MSMRVRNKGLQSAQHALRPWLHPKSELTSLQEARIVSVANPLPSFIGFGAPPFLVQVGLWLLLVYFFYLLSAFLRLMNGSPTMMHLPLVSNFLVIFCHHFLASPWMTSASWAGWLACTWTAGMLINTALGLLKPWQIPLEWCCPWYTGASWNCFGIYNPIEV